MEPSTVGRENTICRIIITAMTIVRLLTNIILEKLVAPVETVILRINIIHTSIMTAVTLGNRYNRLKKEIF